MQLSICCKELTICKPHQMVQPPNMSLTKDQRSWIWMDKIFHVPSPADLSEVRHGAIISRRAGGAISSRCVAVIMAEPVMHKGPLTLKQLLEAPRASIFELRLKQAEVLRLAGNDCFKKALLKESLQLYDRALYHANFEESQMKFDFKEQHQREIYATIDPIRLNGARVSLKTGEYRRAIAYLQVVLAREKEELKPADKTLQNAYFLLGKAHYSLSLYDEAEEALLRARGIATRPTEPAKSSTEAMIQEKLPPDRAIEVVEEEQSGISVEDGVKKLGDLAAITKLLNDCKVGRRNERREEKSAWKGKLDNGAISSQPQKSFNTWGVILTCIVALILSVFYNLYYNV